MRLTIKRKDNGEEMKIYKEVKPEHVEQAIPLAKWEFIHNSRPEYISNSVFEATIEQFDKDFLITVTND